MNRTYNPWNKTTSVDQKRTRLQCYIMLPMNTGEPDRGNGTSWWEILPAPKTHISLRKRAQVGEEEQQVEQGEQEPVYIHGGDQQTEVMVVTAVADPTLAPWWESKDAKNLFVPNKSDVNMHKVIIRRIDILELARTDPNRYMEIIEGGNMAITAQIWMY